MLVGDNRSELGGWGGEGQNFTTIAHRLRM